MSEYSSRHSLRLVLISMWSTYSLDVDRFTVLTTKHRNNSLPPATIFLVILHVPALQGTCLGARRFLICSLEILHLPPHRYVLTLSELTDTLMNHSNHGDYLGFDSPIILLICIVVESYYFAQQSRMAQTRNEMKTELPTPIFPGTFIGWERVIHWDPIHPSSRYSSFVRAS